MSATVFISGTVVLPERLVPDGMVVCSKGRITAVEKARRRVPEGAEIVDAKGGYISPRFVDIHVHGGAGADFMEGTTDAVRKVWLRSRQAWHYLDSSNHHNGLL